jgi:hypothetical protein
MFSGTIANDAPPVPRCMSKSKNYRGNVNNNILGLQKTPASLKLADVSMR